MRITEHDWRTVAEAFGTPPEQRTVKQKRMASCGLCGAVTFEKQGHVNPGMPITVFVYRELGNHFGQEMGIKHVCWPFNRDKSDEQRCLFALLMAESGIRIEVKP